MPGAACHAGGNNAVQPGKKLKKGGPGDVGGLSGPQQMPALKNGLRDYLA